VQIRGAETAAEAAVGSSPASCNLKLHHFVIYFLKLTGYCRILMMFNSVSDKLTLTLAQNLPAISKQRWVQVILEGDGIGRPKSAVLVFGSMIVAALLFA
jgi:hypothetical protein